jgi:hypothetical protein
MRTFIAGLVISIVLSACVRTPGQFNREIPIQIPAVEDIEPTSTPPGLKEYCKAENLVLLVTVNKKGKPVISKCPGITIENKLPDEVDEPVGPPAALGGTQKWRSKDNPDPCIQWSVSGYPFFYCWK